MGLVAVLLLGFWAKSAQSGRPEAILMDPKINVYTAPEGNDLAFVLHAGTHITILDEVDGWLKVEIINGEIGWMPDAGYTRI
jgi:SH3-like domain-containing protein